MKVHGYFVRDGAGITVKAPREFWEGAWRNEEEGDKKKENK